MNRAAQAMPSRSRARSASQSSGGRAPTRLDTARSSRKGTPALAQPSEDRAYAPSVYVQGEWARRQTDAITIGATLLRDLIAVGL